MSNFQKKSKDYGEPDITYQLAGYSDSRDRYTVTRLSEPKKGINIINGQKVVMK